MVLVVLFAPMLAETAWTIHTGKRHQLCDEQKIVYSDDRLPDERI